MTLIEIDKSTIVKNPNAGQTRSYLPGMVGTTGVCYGELPAWLKDSVEISCLRAENGQLSETEFYFNDTLERRHIEAVKACRKPRIEIKVEQHYVTCDSAYPEPTHRYKYLNTPLECDNCGKKVPYYSIKQEDDWEGYSHDVCPFCKDIDTFEYKLQSITDVL